MRAKAWQLYLIYSGTALLVLLPLLKPGFVLTLDMVFTPHFRLPATVGSSYLFYALLYVLNFALPSDVIEKIVLFAILFLSGLGIHRLVAHLSGEKEELAYQIGAYFGGIFYMINPFTYDRFMAGQYAVLLGYALLPWFTRTLLIFLQRPSVAIAIGLTAWAVAISILSIHTIGLMVVLGAIALGTMAWRRRKDKTWLRKTGQGMAACVIIFILASSYWLVPLGMGKGSTASAITSFTADDQQAFATAGNGAFGKVANVIRLQGFWVENRGMYTLPQEQVRGWGLLALIIWILVVVGGVSYWRNRQRTWLVVFGGSALVAVVLAIGTLNGWLAAHLPLFAGYREPEKFVALVALAYAALAARGIAAGLKYCQEHGGKLPVVAGSIVLLVLPLIWTSTMLWGFGGQLRPVQYPAGWYAMNAQLNHDASSFKVLFLPWHLYMYYGFAGRIIASPAPRFFDKPIIVSNDPEFRGAAPTPNTEASNVTKILAAAGSQSDSDIGARLARYHVKYVLLAHEDDYLTYGYLSRQTDLRLVHKSATLELYRNEAFRE